jgi:CHAD domain-containing protein
MAIPNRYINALQHNLHSILQHPVDKEMLHALRVEIKKLRALWLIHPIGNAIDFKISFPKIRQIFQLAARARDFQMTHACLQSLPGFLKHHALEEKLKKEIKKALGKVKRQLKERKFNNGLIDELRKYKIYYKSAAGFHLNENFKTFRIKTAEGLSLLSLLDANGLHDLRKMVKYVIYQSEAFESLDHSSHLNKHTLNTLQHMLGNWHDWWNVVTWLEKQKATPEDRSFENLSRQAHKKELMLRRELVKEIKLLSLSKKKPAAK